MQLYGTKTHNFHVCISEPCQRSLSASLPKKHLARMDGTAQSKISVQSCAKCPAHREWIPLHVSKYLFVFHRACVFGPNCSIPIQEVVLLPCKTGASACLATPKIKETQSTSCPPAADSSDAFALMRFKQFSASSRRTKLRWAFSTSLNART